MKTLRMLLLSIIITLLLTEALLSVFDPYGLHFLIEAGQIQRQTHARRGYVSKPGTYRFSSWVAMVNSSYERVAPHASGECVIVFLGDSVTFGRGVDDDETWTNLIAQALTVRAINTGVDGYNSANVRAVIEDYSPTLFVYLIIENDVEETRNFAAEVARRAAPYRAATARYLIFFARRPQILAQERARFEADMDSLAALPNILFVSFNRAFGRSLSRWGVRLIPPYTGQLSIADPHPNREGHREIAASITPLVRAACVGH